MNQQGTSEASVTPARAAAALAEYERALAGAALAAQSRRAYRSRVAGYLRWLQETGFATGDPLADPRARDRAVPAYRSWLQHEQAARPTTVNAVLTALDHFYRHLRLGPAMTGRESVPAQVRRALPAPQRRQFLTVVDRHATCRDQAIAYTLVFTGLRVTELVALDLPDLAPRAHPSRLLVRQRGPVPAREVPLDPPPQPALRAWLNERRTWSGAQDTPAVFLNRRGGRLSTRTVDELVARLGRLAGLSGPDQPLTPLVLRRTFGASLLATGTDLAVVAGLLGHRRLETTRRLLAEVAAPASSHD